MSIQIESDLKEILERIEKRFDKVDEKFEKLDGRFEKLDNKIDQLDDKIEDIDKRLIKVETKLDEGITPRLDTLSEQVKEIRNSQQAQIWTLIGILFTAVTGFLIAVGKFVLSGNSV